MIHIVDRWRKSVVPAIAVYSVNTATGSILYLCCDLIFSVQHIALRLMCQPHLDEHIWDMILHETDWVTCLRLDLVRIAKELLPCDETAQRQLDSAVASGETVLVSRMLQIFSGFPDMDIAAEADQFEMLELLAGLDKAGTCICRATEQMAMHAATNNNHQMLEWLIENRLEVDGKDILVAAAEVGNLAMIHWVLEQWEHCRIAGSLQHEKALSEALQGEHMEVIDFLIEHFGLQAKVCSKAVCFACKPLLRQLLQAYSQHIENDKWANLIVYSLQHDDPEVLCIVLEFESKIRGSCFSGEFICSFRPLLDIAARHGNVSLIQPLYARMPDNLKKIAVTDNTLAAVACQGDTEMVMLKLDCLTFSASWPWPSAKQHLSRILIRIWRRLQASMNSSLEWQMLALTISDLISVSWDKWSCTSCFHSDATLGLTGITDSHHTLKLVCQQQERQGRRTYCSLCSKCHYMFDSDNSRAVWKFQDIWVDLKFKPREEVMDQQELSDVRRGWQQSAYHKIVAFASSIQNPCELPSESPVQVKWLHKTYPEQSWDLDDATVAKQGDLEMLMLLDRLFQPQLSSCVQYAASGGHLHVVCLCEQHCLSFICPPPICLLPFLGFCCTCSMPMDMFSELLQPTSSWKWK